MRNVIFIITFILMGIGGAFYVGSWFIPSPRFAMLLIGLDLFNICLWLNIVALNVKPEWYGLDWVGGWPYRILFIVLMTAATAFAIATGLPLLIGK